jgi:hypothetical protein
MLAGTLLEGQMANSHTSMVLRTSVSMEVPEKEARLGKARAAESPANAGE